MKPPVPPQPSPSQQNLAATVTLGLLMVVFLLIPILAGRNRGPAFPEQRPTVAQSLGNQTFVGPAVPADSRPWPAEVEPAWAPNSGFAAQLQKISLMLVLMTGLIFVTLKLVNRYFPGLLRPGGAAPRATPLMQVLEKQAVAPGINLAVVRIGTKHLVLGMTEHSVSTVCELSPEELAVEETPAAEEEQAEPAARPDAVAVYRGIFRQYLSIIPGMGGSKQ